MKKVRIAINGFGRIGRLVFRAAALWPEFDWVLVNDPKALLMDEPFGALDALTRERMNVELLRIWEQSGKTIILVTHGIGEAVFLGQRVVVLTAGPARMAADMPIDLPARRTLEIKTSEAFGRYSREIYALLGMN